MFYYYLNLLCTFKKKIKFHFFLLVHCCKTHTHTRALQYKAIVQYIEKSLHGTLNVHQSEVHWDTLGRPQTIHLVLYVVIISRANKALGKIILKSKKDHTQMNRFLKFIFIILNSILLYSNVVHVLQTGLNCSEM